MEENNRDEALIRYRAATVAQQELEVLTDVNFELHPGEFVYFIGKVGSGKTSLLKTFYAELDLKKAEEATVMGHDMLRIKRKRIPELRRRMGIVFQDFQLLTDRTVQANLAFVLKATGWKDRAAIDARIAEVLEQVGMGGKGYKMPNELSGGEQQRIVIARAILNKPDIILADEPTGNLDPDTGHRIVELLQGISREGAAVVMTTHNLQLLEEFPGTIYRFADHRITLVDDPEEEAEEETPEETPDEAEDETPEETPDEAEEETPDETPDEAEEEEGVIRNPD